jgi:hypothetical protein
MFKCVVNKSTFDKRRLKHEMEPASTTAVGKKGTTRYTAIVKEVFINSSIFSIKGGTVYYHIFSYLR